MLRNTLSKDLPIVVSNRGSSMNKKKGIISLALCTLFLASCNTMREASFNFETDFSEGYNKNLWYKNDLESDCADPSVIYSEEDQYYYMYMTSDDLGSTGFNIYRSKTLNYWEKLAPAFLPDPHSWAITDLWAPNAIKIGNKYYLYYSGYNHTSKENGISVAVSDTPYGPFHEYEGFDANDKVITRNDQIFKFGFPTIDAAPFIDSDGTMYLYFAKDQVDDVSSCYGVKLLDPVTADYSSLKALVYPGKSQVDEPLDDIPWEINVEGRHWNEAPFMIKVDNKYILTYSANPWYTINYGVGYAVSDNPLGPFTKPHSYENENLLLGIEPEESLSSWDFMRGTGHHCFFYSGDELMIGYHALKDRYYGLADKGRAFALDRVLIDDGKLFINGPTYSIQYLPSAVSGYKNIAKEALLTADSTNDKVLLVDGKVPMHVYRSTHLDLEAKFTAGTHDIVFEFDKEREIAAVAIYNSFKYETLIREIKVVDIEGYGDAQEVQFNSEYLQDYENNDAEYIRPGCPFVVEMDNAHSKKITITIESDKDFALSDIVILGRDIA